MIAANDNWRPDQLDAVEEAFHQADLIGRSPMLCEIEFFLQMRGVT